MKRHSIFFIYFSFFVAKVYSQKDAAWDSGASGTFEKVTQFYEIQNNTSVPWDSGMTERIIYKSHMTIQPVKGFSSTTINKQTTTTYWISFYEFNHKPTGMIYQYRNFSDTALPLQKFRNDGPVSMVSDRFIGHYDDEPDPERKIIKEEKLQDTLIETISYERNLIHYKDAAGKSYYFIAYFGCDEKMRFLKLYDLDLRRNEQDVCPVIKYYMISSPENKLLLLSEEIFFLADSLTEEEEKVFAAWEKRAKEDSIDK